MAMMDKSGTGQKDDDKRHPVQVAPGRKNSQVPSATGIRRAAMDWLARREYARCEIDKKLRRRFPDAIAAIGPVLDELEHEGLLNTSRFVESFLRSRIQRGHGPQRIAADLRARGFSASNDLSSADQDESGDMTETSGSENRGAETGGIASGISSLCRSVDWLAQARETRRRRFGESLPSGPVERNRQAAFLQRRGFSAAICRAACQPVRDE